jgi:hypothetical protein
MSLKSMRVEWDAAVSLAQRRAKRAVAGLIAAAALHGVGGLVALWQISLLGNVASGEVTQKTLQLSDSVFAGVGLAQTPMLIVAGVLFLLWLRAAVTAAHDLVTAPHLRWSASQATWSFFLPFVNLVRPYHVVRDLHDVLDPEGIPEPAPRLDPKGVGDYRSVKLKKAPPPSTLPHASIGAWWGLYIVSGLMGYGIAGSQGTSVDALVVNRQVVALSSAVEIVAAGLAVMVVRAIDGRLSERLRRVRHASKAELREWGFEP